jgi:hypothetical protein
VEILEALLRCADFERQRSAILDTSAAVASLRLDILTRRWVVEL